MADLEARMKDLENKMHELQGRFDQKMKDMGIGKDKEN